MDRFTALITTVAGSGVGAFAGDGGPATSAQLNQPSGVAVDSAGNLFIADSLNSRIRKVAAATGVITAVAGSSTGAGLGYAGDGGPATSASLNSPQSIAFDTAGNLYIADTGNNVIRKVNVSTGVITTFAGVFHLDNLPPAGDGGPAASAYLNSPVALAIDASGNLYISCNDRIRKVTASTNVITTIAGNGSFSSVGDGVPALSTGIAPAGIAFDSLGNLLLTDRNNLVRRIDTSGIITTLAGDGRAGFRGDGGQALAAELYRPFGIALNSQGDRRARFGI